MISSSLRKNLATGGCVSEYMVAGSLDQVPVGSGETLG
jgi:hypothetical protein